nr:unnamed protein product [Spirometra erinaceieuropaei]
MRNLTRVDQANAWLVQSPSVEPILVFGPMADPSILNSIWWYSNYALQILRHFAKQYGYLILSSIMGPNVDAKRRTMVWLQRSRLLPNFCLLELASPLRPASLLIEHISVNDEM